ncbi:hypothetical protein K439DRAFT_1356468 [Ramaria rubella]|nr:hypothetical protein K439DRAFT_1356468 [Ramaria rubella]
MSSLLLQLHTGHVPLNKHLHQIGRTALPKCPHCPDCEETVHHLIMMCPAYVAERQTLQYKLRQGARSIKNLLSQPKAIPHLLRYVRETG